MVTMPRSILPSLGPMLVVLAGLPALAAEGSPGQPAPALERYRCLEFPPAAENFDKGWQERVALEFEVIDAADLASLRAGLKNSSPIVRSIAARALGIRADGESASALAELVKSDPEPMVRIRAVESLGYLKRMPEVIALAREDKDVGTQWAARLSAGTLESDVDFAASVRQAYAGGIRREDMDQAKVGKPAPDFAALTVDGKPFKLSSVLGKKPIAIYFAAYEG
jgi:hypothetical protein